MPPGDRDNALDPYRVLGYMSERSFAVVSTALGAFGVAWTDHGIVRTWLHDRTLENTRRQVVRAFPAARERTPPDSVAAAIDDVVALLAGGSRTVEGDLDTNGIPEFDRRVYELARRIPPGETITYGAIAKALGEEPMKARDVGLALSRNPFAPIVPCHRVVAANGRLGGYSAPGGASTKRRLLELEGARIVAPPPRQQGMFDSV
jgi:methylated-DNA-[protein]-cysteine S-methyltransferase